MLPLDRECGRKRECVSVRVGWGERGERSETARARARVCARWTAQSEPIDRPKSTSGGSGGVAGAASYADGTAWPWKRRGRARVKAALGRHRRAATQWPCERQVEEGVCGSKTGGDEAERQ